MHAPQAPTIATGIRNVLTAFALFALLAGCTGGRPADEAGNAMPATETTGESVTPEVPATAPPDAGSSPAESDQQSNGDDKLVVDYSCNGDAQCTIKDIGSCCGYRPACVNIDSPTDPAGVKAACERDGRASICGFPAITGCQCVNNRCEGISDPSADAARDLK